MSVGKNQDDIPLAQRDVVDSNSSTLSILFNYVTGMNPINPIMFSAQSFLRDGKLGSNTLDFNLTVDWDAGDAFTDAFAKIQRGAAVEIGKSPILQDLLNKDNWSKDDREIWEKNIEEIISDQLLITPGLKNYRTPSEDSSEKTNSLNELSHDIKNNTATKEFDCDIMAAVKGSLLQKMDNIFLDSPGTDPDAYKAPGNYFLAYGMRYTDAAAIDNAGFVIANHGWITSSKTGNIIEATSSLSKPDLSLEMIGSVKNDKVPTLKEVSETRDIVASISPRLIPSSYIKGMTSFEDQANGKPFVAQKPYINDDIYGGSSSSKDLKNSIEEVKGNHYKNDGVNELNEVIDKIETYLDASGAAHLINSYKDAVASYNQNPTSELLEMARDIKSEFYAINNHISSLVPQFLELHNSAIKHVDSSAHPDIVSKMNQIAEIREDLSSYLIPDKDGKLIICSINDFVMMDDGVMKITKPPTEPPEIMIIPTEPAATQAL